MIATTLNYTIIERQVQQCTTTGIKLA